MFVGGKDFMQSRAMDSLGSGVKNMCVVEGAYPGARVGEQGIPAGMVGGGAIDPKLQQQQQLMRSNSFQ